MVSTSQAQTLSSSEQHVGVGPPQELENADAGGIAEGLEGGECVVHERIIYRWI